MEYLLRKARQRNFQLLAILMLAAMLGAILVGCASREDTASKASPEALASSDSDLSEVTKEVLSGSYHPPSPAPEGAPDTQDPNTGRDPNVTPVEIEDIAAIMADIDEQALPQPAFTNPTNMVWFPDQATLEDAAPDDGGAEQPDHEASASERNAAAQMVNDPQTYAPDACYGDDCLDGYPYIGSVGASEPTDQEKESNLDNAREQIPANGALPSGVDVAPPAAIKQSELKDMDPRDARAFFFSQPGGTWLIEDLDENGDAVELDENNEDVLGRRHYVVYVPTPDPPVTANKPVEGNYPAGEAAPPGYVQPTAPRDCFEAPHCGPAYDPAFREPVQKVPAYTPPPPAYVPPPPSATYPNYNLALVNNGTNIPYATMQEIGYAIQEQINQDFGPQWNTQGNIKTYKSVQDYVNDNLGGAPRWPVFLNASSCLNTNPCPGIGGPGGGDHWSGAGGTPWGNAVYDGGREDFPFAGNGHTSKNLSHEFMEIMVNPFPGNYYADKWNKYGNFYYRIEVGDPVYGDEYGYFRRGIKVSDFVRRDYFTLDSSGPYDYRGHLTKAAGYKPLKTACPHGNQMISNNALHTGVIFPECHPGP